MSDWERDTGVPWGEVPQGTPYYGEQHYRDGRLIVGEYGPWRLRDKIARFRGYHCWECWWLGGEK